jgi:cysteine synthase
VRNLEGYVQRPGLATEVVDRAVYERAVARFREQRIVMPTFAVLADPNSIPASAVGDADPNAADPRNLFRVHWHNAADGRATVAAPLHVVLPRALTGVDAPIVVALADRFPMIASHKVLAAYACLAPRIVTGQFDPTAQRAVWPSTGNYCRGGVAISRIMGCRGVAVLPEGMSQERFDWLGRWVVSPDDIIRTPGTESNVKEIYDRCAELAREPDVVIFNQFSEYPNHLAHYLVTGRALEDVLAAVREEMPSIQPFAFVSATGSAGTIAAGDWLKERLGTKTVAVEALECPTMLENGFGEHNIQGIGDKHIPLIHNVMATDYVVGVSDRSTDQLNLLFNTDVGRTELSTAGVGAHLIDALSSFGLSSICNVLAAIKLARFAGLGPDDAIVTVATDGAAMYRTEADRVAARDFAGSFDGAAAARVMGEHLLGAAPDHVLELTDAERRRIFNLGYYTWVEQQGVPYDEFVERREQSFWSGLRDLLPRWDALIDEFNARVARSAVAQ